MPVEESPAVDSPPMDTAVPTVSVDHDVRQRIPWGFRVLLWSVLLMEGSAVLAALLARWIMVFHLPDPPGFCYILFFFAYVLLIGGVATLVMPVWTLLLNPRLYDPDAFGIRPGRRGK